MQTRSLLHAAAAAMTMAAGPALAGDTVATYELRFDATWSQQTHPLEFPANPHFSPLIGGTHSVQTRFWELGGIATQGMENMAETGSTQALRNEVNAEINAGTAHAVVSGGGTGSPGTRTTTLELTSSKPLATVVTMIAPSPDWFVGVDSLRLAENGEWLEQVVVELAPYDAGTDSGVSYNSANRDTDPHEPIRDLSDEHPFEGTPPLGTFTFTLISVEGCAADFNDDGGVNTLDVLAFLNAWSAGDASSDVNADGEVNTQDVLVFLNLWNAGCA